MSDEQPERPAFDPQTPKIPERFGWKQPAPAEKLPPTFATSEALHASATYGPQICPDCWGAGWMNKMPEDPSASSTLVKCERCASEIAKADNRRIGECWQMSGLTPQSPDALTFGTFRWHDEASRDMRKAAAAFSLQPKGWLTMWGNWGGGKSHLGEAITRELLGRRMPCLYMRAADLFAYLGATDRIPGANVDYENRLYWVQRTAVLVLDEFAKETKTDAVMRLRTSLLDFRYQRARANEGGATVILSNTAPDEWPDPAMASRAQDARFVCIRSTDVDYRKLKRA